MTGSYLFQLLQKFIAIAVAMKAVQGLSQPEKHYTSMKGCTRRDNAFYLLKELARGFKNSSSTRVFCTTQAFKPSLRMHFPLLFLLRCSCMHPFYFDD